MSEELRALYQTRIYPAMSHPCSDPALAAVAAMLGGLDTPSPSKARVLEIGCGPGLNLIPLALRWPESHFTGIDWSQAAVEAARDLAAAAGAENIGFHTADLREFETAPESFDFIIAHGFFSWVPDDVKSALFRFCRHALAPDGIATISFNIEQGWRPRFPVIAKVRAIMNAGAADEMSALDILRSVTAADSPELAIIDDMLAKGPEVLAFDDFAPVNDPWPLDRFVGVAAESGLRWLGESDPGENLPRHLDPAAVEEIFRNGSDPLASQVALDALSSRTFRSGVLCRSDALLAPQVSLKRVLELSVRAGTPPDSAEDRYLFDAVNFFAPCCVPLPEVAAMVADVPPNELARRVYQGIQTGSILPRIEPVRFSPDPPVRPKLDAFRLECARRMLPLVDIWHRPCSFPEPHYEVLALMDGTLDLDELARIAASQCPELAFEPWLRHLARRGVFA